MGNQREVRQVEPRQCSGAALRVRTGAAALVRAIVEPLNGRFYTYYRDEGEPVAFPNFDRPDANLGVLSGSFVVIQSGGKMWCGYENFVQHISDLSQYLEDALFYVGDEVDYIDEFRIRSGRLQYVRVHHGGWLPIQDYLQDISVQEVVLSHSMDGAKRAAKKNHTDLCSHFDEAGSGLL